MCTFLLRKPEKTSPLRRPWVRLESSRSRPEDPLLPSMTSRTVGFQGWPGTRVSFLTIEEGKKKKRVNKHLLSSQTFLFRLGCPHTGRVMQSTVSLPFSSPVVGPLTPPPVGEFTLSSRRTLLYRQTDSTNTMLERVRQT